MMDIVKQKISEDVCSSSLLARAEAAAALISMRETRGSPMNELDSAIMTLIREPPSIPSPALSNGSDASLLVQYSPDQSSTLSNFVIEDSQHSEAIYVATADNESHPLANTQSLDTKKKRTAKTNMLKFPPCVICDGKASGLHYGSNTCEACKNFYRRYLIGKQSYVCMKNGSCEISCKNRGNCSACRLAKCLSYGMSKDKSKMGRYSYTRRTETIKKVKEIEEKGHISPESSSSQRACSEETLRNVSLKHGFNNSGLINDSNDNKIGQNGRITTFDKETVEALKLAKDEINPFGDEVPTQEILEEKLQEHHERYQTKVNTFGSMKNVSMAEYRSLLQCGIDIDDQLSFMKYFEHLWTDEIIGRYCTFAKKIPGFSTLSYDDQSNLLKATHCELFSLLLHQCYNDKLGVYMECGGKPFHLDEVSNKFYSREVMVKGLESLVYFQKLQLADDELVLLMALVTMSPDVCKLENYRLVEEVQLDCMLALQTEIYSKLDRVKGNKRLAKFVDGMVKLREVASMYYKSYQDLCNDDYLMKEIPTMADMLPDNY